MMIEDNANTPACGADPSRSLEPQQPLALELDEHPPTPELVDAEMKDKPQSPADNSAAFTAYSQKINNIHVHITYDLS